MQQHSADEPFRLGQPPKPKKKYENKPAARQVLLLVDMDDLEGQLSMFQLNGPKETDHGPERVPQSNS